MRYLWNYWSYRKMYCLGASESKVFTRFLKNLDPNDWEPMVYTVPIMLLILTSPSPRFLFPSLHFHTIELQMSHCFCFVCVYIDEETFCFIGWWEAGNKHLNVCCVPDSHLNLSVSYLILLKTWMLMMMIVIIIIAEKFVKGLSETNTILSTIFISILRVRCAYIRLYRRPS